MLRRISRLLSSVPKLEPLRPQLERSDPRNALNTDFIDTVNSIASEQKRFTITNYDTRIRVNHYLQAVFQRDFNQAFDLLGKFRDKCKVNRTHTSFARNVQLYVSCLSTLVAHFASTSDGSEREFNELGNVRDMIELLPGYVILGVLQDQLTQVRLHLLVAYCRHFDKLSKKHALRRQRARKLTIYLAEKYEITPQSFEQVVAGEYPELMDSFRALWPNLKANSELSEKKLDVQPFLNKNGSMSFTSLCDFISSTRFQFDDDKRPMHEIYDSLPQSQQKYFIDAYLQHNRLRQIEVEKYCGGLQDSLAPKRQESTFQKFSIVHRHWLLQWNTAICENIEALDTEADRSLSKFAFFYTTYPAEKLASIVLTSMLSATLKSGLVGTLKLAKAMLTSLKQSIRLDPELKPVSQQLNHYLNEDDSIEFFCGIIKLATESCKLPIDTEMLSKSSHGQPLFSVGYAKSSQDSSPYHRMGIISLNQDIIILFQSYKDLLHSGSVLLPMLCPPEKWTSPTHGGYLEGLAPMVRSSDEQTTSKYINKAHTTGQLQSLYDVLTQLGSLPWTINKEMLDIFTECLKKPEGFLLIPPPLSELHPPFFEVPKKSLYESDSEYEGDRRAYYKHKREAENEYFGLRGNRISYELMNKVASCYADNGDALYLPHNVDFRGRVYPVVSFLSHHNEDMIRSMLMFWDAKPLGPHGYKWIKYQLANLYSKAKLDMDQSIAFVSENMGNIIASATAPFDGDQWWTKGDNPWQSLALCKEINLIENFRGSVADYMSRIPVHQDGTCNGLQHYAALGGDEAAARSVNLLPGDRNDIYLKVLEIVKRKILDDVENESTKDIARISQPLLLRKLIKRTVMTTVYGVTHFGAARQIQENIESLTNKTHNTVSSEYTKSQIATYIARNVLQSITELFSGAQAIQDWLLRNCLRCLKSFSSHNLYSLKKVDFFGLKHYQPMMWSSLSGFPVVQLYRHDVKKEIVTPLQKVSVVQRSRVSHMNLRKQLNAVAPNFIHSLDAIHLQMTCLEANRQGLSFAGVHDSFWTHACDVPKLNKIIRQEFVRLHHSQIIRNLRDDMIYTNRNAMQVVWVNNSESPALVEAVQLMRQQYGAEQTRRGKISFNESLRVEIENPRPVLALIEEHKPRLWFQSKNGKTLAERYDADVGEEQNVSPKTHTPVLVPVRILPEPPVGKLDIDKVLESEYFFS